MLVDGLATAFGVDVENPPADAARPDFVTLLQRVDTILRGSRLAAAASVFASLGCDANDSDERFVGVHFSGICERGRGRRRNHGAGLFTFRVEVVTSTAQRRLGQWSRYSTCRRNAVASASGVPCAIVAHGNGSAFIGAIYYDFDQSAKPNWNMP